MRPARPRPPADLRARAASAQVEGGTAYKLTTITGQSFWVILTDKLAPPAGIVAVPEVPITVNAGLTTAPAREAADR